MKNFILGIIVTLIIGAWITLAVELIGDKRK